MEYKDRNARSMPAKLHIIKTASEQEPDGEKEADRAAQIQLDLELAQERLQMRRALVARLVDECNSTPTTVAADDGNSIFGNILAV